VRVYGINPVLEALRAGRVAGIQLSHAGDERGNERLAAILRLAGEQGVEVARVDAGRIDRLAGAAHRAHQGIVAEIHGPHTYAVEELVSGARGVPLLVVLDGVEDPHNVGAILRTLDAVGADGLVRQSRHAARLGGAAARASAGAVAHVKIAEVVNIARALERLKKAGVWTVGLAGESRTRYDEIDLTLPTAFVVGAEGAGLRRLVRERCDWLVAIPMAGHVQSLNVSVAAGIALFEAVRQRRR
jgi:23S rRNA (guanosine2251-2'-O)-methyltransferase